MCSTFLLGSQGRSTRPRKRENYPGQVLLRPRLIMESMRRATTTPRILSVYIPLLEIEVSAGDGATNDQPEQIMDRLAFKKTWLDKMNISNKSCRMVYAWGDSMEPGIHDGDAVLVDTSTTAEQFRDGIWVLRTEDGLIVKRLQRTPEGGIIIISDNELYPPIEVKDGGLKSLDLVGRVKAAGAWRRML